MIGRSDEYEKMFRIEGQLWWYRALHERVEAVLRKHFGHRRDMALLDIGCGTGGLLDFLRRRGYTSLRGIDGSADAVTFCHRRKLPVALIDLTQLSGFEAGRQYDVLICNDVFCYFDDPALQTLLADLGQRLRPGGILISNNNAFRMFRGQHDLAVGSSRRFVEADFDRLLPAGGWRITQATYWSFVLAPLILAMRQWQNLQLRIGWRTAQTARSDVNLPVGWLNETLYRLVRAEQTLLPRTPFGSSLFMELRRTATHDEPIPAKAGNCPS